MHSARPKRKKYGTDINRYLGVELPEDRIHVPAHSVDLVGGMSSRRWKR